MHKTVNDDNLCIVDQYEECVDCGYCYEKKDHCIINEQSRCDGCNYCGKDDEAVE